MEAYLALEEAGRPKDARHEYWDGVIRALGGASASHNRVVLALGSVCGVMRPRRAVFEEGTTISSAWPERPRRVQLREERLRLHRDFERAIWISASS